MNRPTRLAAALTALSVFVVLYSLLIVQEILLGTLVVGAIWLAYFCYLLLRILARIARALEEIAEQRREPADSESRD